MMNLKLEEVARENKQNADLIEIYSSLLGVHVEKIAGGDDKTYLLYCLDRPGGKTRTMEAKLECRPKMGGRGGSDEWNVEILRLPHSPFQGLTVGSKLQYADHMLPELFSVMKTAANMHK